MPELLHVANDILYVTHREGESLWIDLHQRVRHYLSGTLLSQVGQIRPKKLGGLRRSNDGLGVKLSLYMSKVWKRRLTVEIAHVGVLCHVAATLRSTDRSCGKSCLLQDS